VILILISNHFTSDLPITVHDITCCVVCVQDFYKFHVTHCVHVTTIVSTSVNGRQSPQCCDDNDDDDDVSDVSVKTSDLAALSTVLKQVLLSFARIVIMLLSV